MPKTTVLIIEDDATLAQMYGAKFEAEGYTVLHAGDGQAGLEMAKSERPDAILLDIMMPKVDGFAALKEIRATKALAKTPVVMLTNLAQDEDIEKGRVLGADDYFVKANQTPSEIVAKVRKLIG